MSDARATWETGRSSEITFWRRVLTTRGGEWPQDYLNRRDPALRLDPNITRRFPETQHLLRVLDVGAGPMTLLGKVWPGHRVELTAVDALASEYDQVLEECGVVPLVRTRLCESERLLEALPRDRFDVVYAQNTLDHSYQPLEAISQMIAVARPGGLVMMGHNTDEAEREQYQGFHQWNFRVEGEDLIVWNRSGRASLRAAIGARAEVVELGPDPNWAWVVLRKA